MKVKFSQPTMYPTNLFLKLLNRTVSVRRGQQRAEERETLVSSWPMQIGRSHWNQDMVSWVPRSGTSRWSSMLRVISEGFCSIDKVLGWIQKKKSTFRWVLKMKALVHIVHFWFEFWWSLLKGFLTLCWEITPNDAWGNHMWCWKLNPGFKYRQGKAFYPLY